MNIPLSPPRPFSSVSSAKPRRSRSIVITDEEQQKSTKHTTMESNTITNAASSSLSSRAPVSASSSSAVFSSVPRSIRYTSSSFPPSIDLTAESQSSHRPSSQPQLPDRIPVVLLDSSSSDSSDSESAPEDTQWNLDDWQDQESEHRAASPLPAHSDSLNVSSSSDSTPSVPASLLLLDSETQRLALELQAQFDREFTEALESKKRQEVEDERMAKEIQQQWIAEDKKNKTNEKGKTIDRNTTNRKSQENAVNSSNRFAAIEALEDDEDDQSDSGSDIGLDRSESKKRKSAASAFFIRSQTNSLDRDEMAKRQKLLIPQSKREMEQRPTDAKLSKKQRKKLAKQARHSAGNASSAVSAASQLAFVRIERSPGVFVDCRNFPFPTRFDDVRHLLMIDLDNWQNFFIRLPFSFAPELFVHCFFGGRTKVIIPRNCLPFLKLQALKHVAFTSCSQGANAADFGLTFKTGYFHAVLKPQIPFTIVSGDSDLEEAVRLAEAEGRKITRINPHHKSDEETFALIKSITEQ